MDATKRTLSARKWWLWTLVLAWCGAIFYLSHQPRTALPRADAHVHYEPSEFDVWLGQWGIDRDVVIKKGESYKFVLSYGDVELDRGKAGVLGLTFGAAKKGSEDGYVGAGTFFVRPELP